MPEPKPAPAGYADEVMLGLGLVLLTTGLWTFVGVGALVAPGLAVVWITLPTRKPFVQRADVLVAKRRAS